MAPWENERPSVYEERGGFFSRAGRGRIDASVGRGGPRGGAPERPPPAPLLRSQAQTYRRHMKMTLGDGFNRRKKLGADLVTWQNRLSQSGSERRTFRTRDIAGDDAFAPQPGTDRATKRHYTIEECRARISEILAEDARLALRISRTNAEARAQVEDLDGTTLDLTIPELLVYKSDLIPKLEAAARAVPTRNDNVNVIDAGDGWVRHRAIKKIERKKETFQKDLKVEEMELLGYDVTDVTEYGIAAREAWNEIDRIQEFAQRVKQAINQANKTELVEL